MSDRTKVGFIGLGIMGGPMARNLLKAGFDVVGYNRSREKVDALVADGGQAGESPADVAARCDFVVSCVTDTPDVQQVVLGQGGIAESAHDGLIYIDCSTISPRVTRELHDTLAERGVSMLDAPISGGSWGAQQGTLSIMVGGEREAFDAAMPVFQAMGKSITFCGPSGSGQSVKLCNQVTVAVNLQAVCESLVLAVRSGLDPDVMIEAIKNGAAGSWALSNLGPRMVARDFAPGFMIDLQQKDLRLVAEAARELNLPLPGTAMVSQFLAAMQADGAGREGTQALVKALEKLAGCEVRKPD